MQTMDAFDRQFPTDDSCREYIKVKRWPNGVRCPRCDASERIYQWSRKPFHWICKNPGCGGRNGYRFSVLSRTIFQDTKVPLKLWFKVGYLMMSAKKGISALQMHRVIFGEESGSDWRTTWYMCHRWRAAMRGEAFPLDGVVEVDETYIGGKDRNRHAHKKSGAVREQLAKESDGYMRPGEGYGYGKVGVVGAIARKGNVVARVIGGMDARTKADFVRSVVSKDVRLVVTDSDHAYNYVREGMPHESVDHGRGEYVRGLAHTNSIESFWSLVKRGVMGSFHHVSKDYLPLYLNEFSFRFNHRKHPDIFGELVATCGQ
jgi:hypothetical protein